MQFNAARGGPFRCGRFAGFGAEKQGRRLGLEGGKSWYDSMAQPTNYDNSSQKYTCTFHAILRRLSCGCRRHRLRPNTTDGRIAPPESLRAIPFASPEGNAS